jgi:hypothetical protein
MTSFPIPSAGMRPILSDCRATVAIVRMGALNAILTIALGSETVRPVDKEKSRQVGLRSAMDHVHHPTRLC